VLAPARLLTFGLPALLLLASPASAHDMRAGHQVLSGQRVRVEAWFDTDEPASGASVQVLRSDKSVMTEGRLDVRGIWVFSFARAEEFHVVVRDGTGHLARLTISGRELLTSIVRGPAGQALACLTACSSPLTPLPMLAALHEPAALPPPSDPKKPDEPTLDRSKPSPWREVLTGLAFLLALAAFVISLQNARTLRELKKKQ
jgi:hypothetical protein